MEIGLQQLATDDRQGARAMKSRPGRSARNAREEAGLRSVCKFVFDGKKYRARLTEFQCAVILDAVQKGTLLGTALSRLLGNFNLAVGQCVQWSLQSSSGSPPKLPASQPPPLGCCIYDGGQDCRT